MIFSVSCSNEKSEDEPDDRVSDEDDDDLTDDDSTSDDDDDDTNDSYLIFMPYDRYYFNDLWISVADEVLEPGARLLLDGEELDPVLVQKVELPDGEHSIELFGAKQYHKKEFIIEAVQVESYPVFQAQLNINPVYVDLPSAAGAGMPLRITVENKGSERVTDLGFFSPGQPDLRSVQSMQNYLTVMTSGKSWHEKAMILFDFVIRWSASLAPPLYNEDENSFMPDILKSWGYGYCGEQAILMGYLAWLTEDSDKKAGGWFFVEGETEYPNTGIRLVTLNGHIVLELHYDNDWHLFDPSTCSIYYDDSQNVLCLSDIEADASMIMDFTDQDGQSICGNSMEDMIDIYGSTEDNEYGAISIPSYDGTPGGFVLDPGDILELYPFGYGVFLYSCPAQHEQDCDYPGLMGNGVLKKTISNPTTGALATIEQAYPIVGMNLSISTSTAVQLQLAATIAGTKGQDVQALGFSLLEGDHRLDLSQLMDESTLGIIRSVALSIQSVSAAIDQILVETILQFNPKTMPQITHDQRQIIVDGQGDTILDVRVDAYDQTESVVETYLFADSEGESVSVPNDGKSLVRFSAGLLDGEYNNNGGWAAGHEVEVISDHPGQIEILSNARAGLFEYLPVFTNWTGPDLFDFWGDERLLRFAARSVENLASPIGPVTFQLKVDGVVQSQKVQIDFF